MSREKDTINSRKYGEYTDSNSKVLLPLFKRIGEGGGRVLGARAMK